MSQPQTVTEAELRRDFLGQLAARLDAGARDYGNESFHSPRTAEELLDEIVDVAGWAYVSWVRMRLRLQAIELAAGALEPRE